MPPKTPFAATAAVGGGLQSHTAKAAAPVTGTLTGRTGKVLLLLDMPALLRSRQFAERPFRYSESQFPRRTENGRSSRRLMNRTRRTSFARYSATPWQLAPISGHPTFPRGDDPREAGLEHVQSSESPHAFVPSAAKTVQVMVKDSKRYAGTGGWVSTGSSTAWQ
jgi:hypothetical protein